MEQKDCLIIVLNFGSDHIEKLEQSIRELGVRVKVLEPTAPTEELSRADGIVLSGSHSSVFKDNAPPYNKQVLFIKKPVLGVCYGQQLMVYALGGKVEKVVEKRVIANREFEITHKSPLFDGLGTKEVVWMEHEEGITKLPENFYSIGKTKETENAAIQDKDELLFGVQFHPEITKSPIGKKILKNFIQIACKNKY